MPELTTKTRFAPSPSGFLHLGNARMALFCVLLARCDGGLFLLRIEDTDAQRSAAGYVTALLDDLLWMGLNWQEGPGREGVLGPYAQSARTAVYDRYFTILEQDRLAYPCFCSEQELALSRKTQLAAGQPPRYTGVCAALTDAQVAAGRAQGRRPTLRFRVPHGRLIEFTDLVRGPQRFSSDDIGDFIIRRADGAPAFFFSNALDDALMEVTHVLRGEDHLSNTPRQIMLLNALGLRIPDYGHVALILGPDGAPLAKRHGSHSVREVREAGYFPGALNNYLARLGHHYDHNDYHGLDGLAADFAVGKIGHAPARFDAAQLQFWQQQAIQQATLDELWAWFTADTRSLVPVAQKEAFIAAVRANLSLPADALSWATILYGPAPELDDSACCLIRQAGNDFFEEALRAVELRGADFKAVTAQLKLSTGKTGKLLFQPLRTALTGQPDGPEMARLLPLIGAPAAQQRLAAALNIVSAEGGS